MRQIGINGATYKSLPNKHEILEFLDAKTFRGLTLSCRSRSLLDIKFTQIWDTPLNVLYLNSYMNTIN